MVAAKDTTGITGQLRNTGDRQNAIDDFRGAIKNGVTREELRAVLHVISIYCGIPAGVECFRIAKRVLAEIDGEG